MNDIGEQVANAMQFDLEYDNLIMASMRGRAGQGLGGGFSGGKAQLGVRTTKATKKVGCSNLKQLVEDNKIIIEDYDCINELTTFIVKSGRVHLNFTQDLQTSVPLGLGVIVT